MLKSFGFYSETRRRNFFQKDSATSVFTFPEGQLQSATNGCAAEVPGWHFRLGKTQGRRLRAKMRFLRFHQTLPRKVGVDAARHFAAAGKSRNRAFASIAVPD